MVDYNMTPMTKAWFRKVFECNPHDVQWSSYKFQFPAPVEVVGSDTTVLQFRYTIEAHPKLNAFKPKPIEGELLDVRYSQLGGCFSKYNELLCSPNVGVVWEAAPPLFWIMSNLARQSIVKPFKSTLDPGGQSVGCNPCSDHSHQAKILFALQNSCESQHGCEIEVGHPTVVSLGSVQCQRAVMIGFMLFQQVMINTIN